MVIGLLLALAATTADNLGVVLQASEARRAPAGLGLSFGLVRRLMRMRLWILGGVLLVVAVALQAGALTVAPLTLVQATVAFGVVVLVGASSRVLGQRLGLHHAVGVAILVGAIVGVALLSPPPAHNPTNWHWLGIISAGCAGAAAVPYVIHRRSGRLVAAPWLAAGAGAAYAGDAAILKAIADTLSRHMLGPMPILLAILAVLGVAGFLIEETALSIGSPTTVNPIIMLFQIGVPIALGPLVFDEPMPAGARGVLLMLCFAAAVLGAVALSRAPTVGQRSTGERPGAAPRGRARSAAG